MSKKYNYKDDFEMLYLRHEYLSKCKHIKAHLMKEFEPIIQNTALLMFKKYYVSFSKMNFQLEDVQSIAHVYAGIFLTLYSLRGNKKVRNDFLANYYKKYQKIPDAKTKYNQDRNLLINFLRQKLNHLSVLCTRKGRNVVGTSDLHVVIAETAHPLQIDHYTMVHSYRDYGYRSLDKKEFNEILNNYDPLSGEGLKDKYGYRVFEIFEPRDQISESDYRSSFHDKIENNPEISFEEREEDEIFREKCKNFNVLDQNKKINKLNIFLTKNKDNKFLKKEIILAKKWKKAIRSGENIGFELEKNI